MSGDPELCIEKDRCRYIILSNGTNKSFSCDDIEDAEYRERCILDYEYDKLESFINTGEPGCDSFLRGGAKTACISISINNIQGCLEIEDESIKTLCVVTVGENSGGGGKVCELVDGDVKESCRYYFSTF